MKSIRYAWLIVLGLLLAACGQPQPPEDGVVDSAARRCYPFSAPVGGPFGVQAAPIFVTPEADIFARPYLEGGAWYFGGELRQQNTNFAAGTAPELVPAWINLGVLPHQPLTQAGFRFGEYFPHNNIEINGSVLEVGYLANLGGQVIGGVQVNVTLDPVQPVGGNTGLIRLVPVTVPDIVSFSVGGQETHIDNVCLEN